MAFAAEIFLGALCLDPISRVTSSANGIQSMISNIYSYTTYPNVVNALRRLDIEASIRILDNLICELDVSNKNNTINECINLLKEIILEIERELGDIHAKLAYNRSIYWLSYVRSYKFTSSIQNLEMLKAQLDNRAEKLFIMIKNCSHLKINKKNHQSSDLDISIIDKEKQMKNEGNN